VPVLYLNLNLAGARVSSEGGFYGKPIFGTAHDLEAGEQAVEDVLLVDVGLSGFECLGDVGGSRHGNFVCFVDTKKPQLFFTTKLLTKFFCFFFF
jgi:hypothetical protein